MNGEVRTDACRSCEAARMRDEKEIRQDLRVALEEILAGKTVSKPFTTAIGCGIPDGQ